MTNERQMPGERVMPFLAFEATGSPTLTVGTKISIDNIMCECWLHKFLEKHDLYCQPKIRFYEITASTCAHPKDDE